MRLTIDLPPEVWARLDAEAHDKGIAIGTHLKRLVIARDAKRQGASPSTDVSRNRNESE